ncbi:MAG TPA: pentapeptide repeat-containing protein, partial [Mycobacteriales bacterium]|nr:pentapeptide repeat-containing protein [Mycobacteriales bacterium]
SCRFSTLRVVTIRDCQLPEADFTEVEFDQVLIERCDLRGAKFDHAKVKKLRIAGCNLAGASGALDLRGASMDLDDVLSLAPSLARENGITIE